MRAAVVIVNTNELKWLPRCMDALSRQTLAPMRTVVADNASTDGSVEMLRERYPWVEVLELGRNRGFAGANNAAVREIEDCELVTLLNADAFPEPRWLEALVETAREHPRAAFFASRMMRVHDPEELDGSGDMYHVSGLAWRRHNGMRIADVPLALEPAEVFSACGGAAMYRRDAWVEAGGFDESFFGYFEDTDLAFRMRLAGHRGRYVPDAVVHHVGSGTTGVESDYTLYHSHRNLVWSWVRNMPWPLLLLYLPQHLAINLGTTLWFSLRGHGAVMVRAKRDALRDLPRVLRERRELQRGRRVGARDLRGLMATGAEGLAAMPALDRELRRVRGWLTRRTS